MQKQMKLLPNDLKTTQITNDVGEENYHHLYEPDTITAINAAIAINRPLLIRGETGIGKSQLAKAVAQELERVFIPFVCDAHTESRDLLWQFDAVSRLAEAQIQGAMPVGQDVIPRNKRKTKALDMDKFIVPQALWWALNWASAENMQRANKPAYQAPCHPNNGAVVLIDEIDKTNADVPNGLLEVLGNHAFHPQGIDPVRINQQAVAPLIIITTNGERLLPDAFIRRCLALHLDFPVEEDKQRDFLITRGKENYPEFHKVIVDETENTSLLEQAANFLIEDRKAAKARQLYPLCGQAEYFDLLRGIKQLQQQSYGEPGDLLNQLRPYTYQKLKG